MPLWLIDEMKTQDHHFTGMYQGMLDAIPSDWFPCLIHFVDHSQLQHQASYDESSLYVPIVRDWLQLGSITPSIMPTST